MTSAKELIGWNQTSLANKAARPLPRSVSGQLFGMAANSLTTVSLDLPLISVNLAVTSKTWPDLRRAKHLGKTVLADHHDLVCRRLAGPVEYRFDDSHSVTEDGAVTLNDGLARFGP